MTSPSFGPKLDKWSSENKVISSSTTCWTCPCPRFLTGQLLNTDFFYYFFFAFHREGAAWNWDGDRPVPPAHDGRQGEHAVHQCSAERGPADGQRCATGGAQDVHQRHHLGRLPPTQSMWRPPAFPSSHQSGVFMVRSSPRSHLAGNQPEGSYGDITVI